MAQLADLLNNHYLDSIVEIDYPDFNTQSEIVKEKFESLHTKINVFRMLAYSPSTFVELMDLVEAIFKKLILSDYHRELLILLTASKTDTNYVWDHHVVISQAHGVSADQIIAIAEQRIDDSCLFSESDIVLMRFGRIALEQGKAPAVILKRALEIFTIEETSDALIVVGFYSMLSCFMKTMNIIADPLPPQEGRWIKRPLLKKERESLAHPGSLHR